MDETILQRVKAAYQPAMVSAEGEEHRLLLALIIEIHRLKPTCLDLLEKLCAEQQKSEIDPEILQQLAHFIFFVMAFGPHADLESAAAEFEVDISRGKEILLYEEFHALMFKWFEETRLEKLLLSTDRFKAPYFRALRIMLTVVMSVYTRGRERQGTLQQYIMFVMESLQQTMKVEGLTLPDPESVEPPSLPVYFPQTGTDAEYREQCRKVVEAYMRRVKDLSLQAGSIQRPRHPKEGEHIQWLARHFLGETIHSLEAKLGVSKGTLSPAINNLKRRMGIEAAVDGQNAGV